MRAAQEQQNFACHIITLNPEAPATQEILRSLQQQGVEAGVFTAVDGRQGYPQLQPGEYLNQRMSMLRNRRYMTATEVGCYLSHLRAVRHSYEAGHQFVCLLEDDVVIEPDFGRVVRELTREPRDIVRLMALKLRRRKVVGEVLPGFSLTRPERGTLGTQAYLLSRAGMEKFLAHASDIHRAIDHVLDHFFLFDLETYAVEPHLVYERHSASTISKRAADAGRRPNLLESLLYHPLKMWFSGRRHLYFWRKRAELYPNQWPRELPGKSPRLRGKGRACEALLESPGGGQLAGE
ncbi:glycosyltransferase family 25 protein [Pseudomaricurvus sp. HS19]|uniref:glycosyltransferase family 25 protein n=1 Tax=Pseudomaricurvus sp. HS19 TaxID=2692626 RepID=UPI00136ABCD9|nr:glycosyltransferase family 25 protein [Pseudomaricurvus sp. HS19]MYM61847.1 hypothetical protein [Pseudomaricurvus sp. HS19]